MLDTSAGVIVLAAGVANDVVGKTLIHRSLLIHEADLVQGGSFSRYVSLS